MRKLLFILLLAPLLMNGQGSELPLVADTVIMTKGNIIVGGTTELVLENNTKNVLNSWLRNKGDGRTEFSPLHIQGDSLLIVGEDTLAIPSQTSHRDSIYQVGLWLYWATDEFAGTLTVQDSFCLAQIINDSTLATCTDTLIFNNPPEYVPEDTITQTGQYIYWSTDFYTKGSFRQLIDSFTVECIWDITSNVTSNTGPCSDALTDDFVFGSYTLDRDLITFNPTYDYRMIYDKSKGFFAAGKASGTEWDNTGRFIGSAVFGFNSHSLGDYSFSAGNTTQSLSYGVSFGQSTQAGVHGFSAGLGTSTNNSLYSFSVGYLSTTAGDVSSVIGDNLVARWWAETAVGLYNTTVRIPESSFGNDRNEWDGNSNVFVVGNGTNSSNLSDALTILKRGEVVIAVDTARYNHTQAMLQVNGSFQVRSIDTSSYRGDTIGDGKYRFLKLNSRPLNQDTVYISDLTGFKDGIEHSNYYGTELHFKEAQGGTTNTWYIATVGTALIDGSPVYAMDAEGKSITIYYFDGNWYVE